MKNKFKKFSCILAACLLLAVSCFAVPSSAAGFYEYELITPTSHYASYDDLWQNPFNGDYSDISTPSYVTRYDIDSLDDPILLSGGRFIYRGGSFLSASATELPCFILFVNDSPVFYFSHSDYLPLSEAEIYEINLSFIETVSAVVAGGGTASIVCQSYSPDVGLYTTKDVGLYGSAFSFLRSSLYGDAELTADMNLVLTLAATTLAVLVIGIPFLICWGIARRFGR